MPPTAARPIGDGVVIVRGGGTASRRKPRRRRRRQNPPPSGTLVVAAVVASVAAMTTTPASSVAAAASASVSSSAAAAAAFASLRRPSSPPPSRATAAAAAGGGGGGRGAAAGRDDARTSSSSSSSSSSLSALPGFGSDRAGGAFPFPPFRSSSSSSSSSSGVAGGGGLFGRRRRRRRKRPSTALGMVLTTPESIIEEASTQNLLDDLIDESVRTSSRKPIMMQFDPSSGWIWRRWKGTVFSETWTSCLKNMCYATVVALFYNANPNLKDALSGFSILWGQLLSVTTFTLTFFLNQSYALWRKCYELSRRLQGRLNDLGLTLAAHASRRVPPSPTELSTYTVPARQVLELVGRYVRLFNLLCYASFTRSHRPILTPRGMRRLVERGIMTPSENRALIDAEVPATQRHNAVVLWIVRVVEEARRAGHVGGGPGMEQQFMEKVHVIRAQYGAIGDELQGRMPLAYAHIVQVLVDVILWMYPLMAFSTGMKPYLGVLGTGLLTIFYQGLFDLAKQFLDPYDNENYGRGEDPLCVDTLVAETNAGSIRWMNGFAEQPFDSQRLRDGEMFDSVLPLHGYSVQELLEKEKAEEEERMKREREKKEREEREKKRKKLEKAERMLEQMREEKEAKAREREAARAAAREEEERKAREQIERWIVRRGMGETKADGAPSVEGEAEAKEQDESAAEGAASTASAEATTATAKVFDAARTISELGKGFSAPPSTEGEVTRGSEGEGEEEARSDPSTAATTEVSVVDIDGAPGEGATRESPKQTKESIAAVSPDAAAGEGIEIVEEKIGIVRGEEEGDATSTMPEGRRGDAIVVVEEKEAAAVAAKEAPVEEAGETRADDGDGAAASSEDDAVDGEGRGPSFSVEEAPAPARAVETPSSLSSVPEGPAAAEGLAAAAVNGDKAAFPAIPERRRESILGRMLRSGEIDDLPSNGWLIDEVGPDGKEYRLSEMLADELWDEEVDRDEEEEEVLRSRRSPMTFEEYAEQAAAIVEAAEDEIEETREILDASPGASAALESKRKKRKESTAAAGAGASDRPPAAAKKRRAVAAAAGGGEGKAERIDPPYDQTRLDGISQLWGLPPEDLEDLATPKGDVAMTNPTTLDEFRFEGVSQLWGEAPSGPTMADEYSSGDAPPTTDFAGVTQLWGEEGAAASSSTVRGADGPPPSSGGVDLSSPTLAGLEWHDEVGPDGQEYRLSQMLADEVWEEELEAAAAASTDDEPLTLKDYVERVAERVEAAEDEFLETEAILNAPPGANALCIDEDDCPPEMMMTAGLPKEEEKEESGAAKEVSDKAERALEKELALKEAADAAVQMVAARLEEETRAVIDETLDILDMDGDAPPMEEGSFMDETDAEEEEEDDDDNDGTDPGRSRESDSVVARVDTEGQDDVSEADPVAPGEEEEQVNGGGEEVEPRALVQAAAAAVRMVAEATAAEPQEGEGKDGGRRPADDGDDDGAAAATARSEDEEGEPPSREGAAPGPNGDGSGGAVVAPPRRGTTDADGGLLLDESVSGGDEADVGAALGRDDDNDDRVEGPSK